MEYLFCMGESPILVWHNGVFEYLHKVEYVHQIRNSLIF